MDSKITLLRTTLDYIRGGWHAKPTETEHPQCTYLLREGELPPTLCRTLFPPVQKATPIEDLIEGCEKIAINEAYQRLDHLPDQPRLSFLSFESVRGGTEFTAQFAKKHPKTKVCFVDTLTREVLDRNRGYTERMQEFFRQNNLSNATHKIIIMDENQHLEPDEKEAHYLITSNGEAAVYALKEAIHRKTETIVLIISGMNKISPRALSKRASEGCDYDEVIKKALKQKRDYRIHSERRLGFALKHARALDIQLWLEENKYKTRLMLATDPAEEHSPEHIIHAYKNKDILR